MKFQSHFQDLGPVPFPTFTGERVYMRPFDPSKSLPLDLLRWQDTVDRMMVEAPKDRECYLMIDQSHVLAGESQRRPGVHIDGYWNPDLRAHGGGGHGGGRIGWGESTFTEPEALLLASDVTGCLGYGGEYEGPIGERGDCSHVDVSHLGTAPLLAGRAYVGNVTFLHESLPLRRDTDRTLVRINVPGWLT